MASRRSSQLSYSRKEAQYSPAGAGPRPRASMQGMSTGRAIAAAAKAASRNKAVRGIAAAAGAAAAKNAVPAAQQRYGVWRDRRVYRDRAIKLARQMGGRYSEDTIIAGEPHFVVWKDGVPVQAFPDVEDLASRPELTSFDAQLAKDPAPLQERTRRRLPGRG